MAFPSTNRGQPVLITPNTSLIRRRTTTQPARRDLRLEFNWHIPFTSRDSKPKQRPDTIYVMEQNPFLVAPLTPPITPIRIGRSRSVQYRPETSRRQHETVVIQPQPTYELLEPRDPAREHERPRPRPPVAPMPPRPRIRDRSRERRDEERRNHERREAANRIAARTAAIDARIDGLRAQLSAENASYDYHRRRANRTRVREIDADIARLTAQLETEQRLRRQVGGNVLHQQEPRSGRHQTAAPAAEEEERIREHVRRGFREERDDDGGGGNGRRTGGDRGLAGDRSGPSSTALAAAREEEIRRLERVAGVYRRSRREGLPPANTDARQAGRAENPYRRSWAGFGNAMSGAGVRVESNNRI